MDSCHTGSNPVGTTQHFWYQWFIFDTVFTLDDVSAIVCVIAKRGVLVECYNLKNLLGSPRTASNPVDVSKCLVAVIVQVKWRKRKREKMYLTPTWFEHATFWSGVRRATVAPRSRWKLLFEITTLSINRYRPIR